MFASHHVTTTHCHNAIHVTLIIIMMSASVSGATRIESHVGAFSTMRLNWISFHQVARFPSAVFWGWVRGETRIQPCHWNWISVLMWNCLRAVVWRCRYNTDNLSICCSFCRILPTRWPSISSICSTPCTAHGHRWPAPICSSTRWCKLMQNCSLIPKSNANRSSRSPIHSDHGNYPPSLPIAPSLRYSYKRFTSAKGQTASTKDIVAQRTTLAWADVQPSRIYRIAYSYSVEHYNWVSIGWSVFWVAVWT